MVARVRLQIYDLKYLGCLRSMLLLTERRVCKIWRLPIEDSRTSELLEMYIASAIAFIGSTASSYKKCISKSGAYFNATIAYQC